MFQPAFEIAAANVDVDVQFVDESNRWPPAARDDCIGDVCFDGRSYMLSMKIMSGAFRDLAAAARARKCSVRSEQLNLRKHSKMNIRRSRGRESAREGFDVVQMFQNILHAETYCTASFFLPFFLYKYVWPFLKKAVLYMYKNHRVRDLIKRRILSFA